MKKLYRSTLMQLILALCTISFVACQEYGIDSQPEAPINIQIDGMDAYTALATSPSNIVINVSSNTPWTVSSDQQWCVPTPASSATSSLVSEIAVKLESNATAQQRVAKLTIQAEGIAEKRVITITQVSKEDLVVIPYDEIVPTKGGEISFNIVSNKAWKIIPSTQFLEKMDKVSGEGKEGGEKEKITITIPENAAARRSGTITVKTDFQEQVFTITQDGVVIEQEEPSESGSIDFGWSATEKTVKIRSNKEWKVKVPKEYASWIAAEKLNDSEIKITLLKQNNLMVTRKGKIMLSTVDIIPGFEDIAFEVAQKPSVSYNGVLDAATGFVKVATTGNGVITNYSLKKGHLVFEFDSMHLMGDSWIFFNMYPNSGNTNFSLKLQAEKDCAVTCGGSGFSWEQKTFKLTREEVNAISKIELIVENDPENAGKLRIRVAINGADKALLKNKSNCYEGAASEPGQVGYIQSKSFEDPGSYFVIKSVTHDPAK